MEHKILYCFKSFFSGKAKLILTSKQPPVNSYRHCFKPRFYNLFKGPVKVSDFPGKHNS